MNLPRTLLVAGALSAAVQIGPASGQSGADSMKNHARDTIARQTQHWHFDGKVSTVDPGARKITINADSIPAQMGGQTTLPYQVPASVSFDAFHVGDRVNGDLVVRDNRTSVENLKLGPTSGNKAAMNRGSGRGEKTETTGKRERQVAAANNSAESQTAPRGPADISAEQRHFFEGVVSTVDENKITINAEGLPGLEGGSTTLPYPLPDAASAGRFHVGDRVTGEMVVKDNRTYVENVKLSNEEKKNSPD